MLLALSLNWGWCYKHPTSSPRFTLLYHGRGYTPKYISGLTLSVDIWDIERTALWFSSVSVILQRERAGAGHCQGLLPVRWSSAMRPETSSVSSRRSLTADSSGEWVDFGLQYTTRLPSDFTTYTTTPPANAFQFASAPGATEAELAGYTRILLSARWVH